MRRQTRLPQFYLGLVLAAMYLPILLVAVYYFNDGRLS